uniref:Ankyrin repeat domain-containing protein n=1 Tax=Florenciella parvula TaxID=236787 RepID=A0A7S2D2Y1_9STRA|mmetsp:Transcript_8508/g.18030  ORF Transcript_8508/g.18030 Transcript_8508/m.18030 type:complete len:214 (+) Transcript_8508:52-693(+)
MSMCHARFRAIGHRSAVTSSPSSRLTVVAPYSPSLGACVKTPANGVTPACIAAKQGHAKVIRLLADLKADLTATTNGGNTPLYFCAGKAHFEATKALLLLGAPITAKDLKQRSNATGNTRQLRADLQAWAADALVQHRAFHGTFLTGCFAHTTPMDTTNPHLPLLAGMPGFLEKIAAFVGIVVGAELRRTRAVGPAIAAIDWAPHDRAWPAQG